MDQRRLILFCTISIGFIVLWNNLVMPVFLPPPKPGQGGEVGQDGADADVADSDATDADGNAADGDTPDSGDAAAGDDGDATAEPVAELDELPEHPHRDDVTLGSLDPDSGYFLRVRLTTRGAAIHDVHMSDPRFKELDDRTKQLRILGNTNGELRTLSTDVHASNDAGGIDKIESQLEQFGKTLGTVDWEVVSESPDAAELRFVTPDGSIEIRKRFSLEKVEGSPSDLVRLRRESVDGYLVHCSVSVVNHGESPVNVDYRLQGPVGIRLENEEHARKYRQIQVAFLGDDDADDDTITAATVFDQAGDGELEKWKTDLRYMGIDVQYFVALLLPKDKRPISERLKAPWVAEAEPVLVDGGNPEKPELSDISVALTSRPQTLDSGASFEHNYDLFVGPKRRELLDPPPLEASTVLDYGITGFVARAMLGLLGIFHHLGLPYGIAIICLTVLVRGCMFPLSRKQALSAQKMKELQPKIQEIKDKYGDDKEKVARAQMELFAKHKYNPFAGCLPLLVQLPIFIGLYTALNASVDLRLSRFLWIDNLAAPDALFRLPFSIWFLGQDFNILPCITVVLFLMQQKMFMPPPTSDEQAMQQKMMSWMTVVFGVLFWHVPSGLCVYFIASSLWGLTERKLLEKMSPSGEPGAADAEAPAASPGKTDGKDRNGRGENGKTKKKVPGFLERWAEAAAAANESGTQTRSNRDSGQRTKKKKKPRR